MKKKRPSRVSSVLSPKNTPLRLTEFEDLIGS
jgi:hypothetical protein